MNIVALILARSLSRFVRTLALKNKIDAGFAARGNLVGPNSTRQHLPSRLSVAFLSLIIVLFSIPSVQGQTDACSVRWSGAAGGIDGSVAFRANEFCIDTPGDVVGWVGPVTMTCKNCLPGDARHSGAFHKGGTPSCTSFDKQMVVEFSQPVAALNWGVIGAKTVTDNHGHILRSNSESWDARFSHGDITSITVSDPVVHDEWLPGFWEMQLVNFSWTLDSVYRECSCERPILQAQPTQTLASGWPVGLDGVDPNWSMLVQVSEDDGLVLRDIKLGQRYMAEKISVPYYNLETSALPKQRGELKPDSADPSMRSRLVNYNTIADDEKLVVEATYVIGRFRQVPTVVLK